MICVFFAVWPLFAISKPVVSATHPPLRTRLPAVNSERVCKYRIFLGKYKEMRSKFVFLRKSSHPGLKRTRCILHMVCCFAAVSAAAQPAPENRFGRPLAEVLPEAAPCAFPGGLPPAALPSCARPERIIEKLE